MGQPHDKPSTPANFPAQKHEFLDGFLELSPVEAVIHVHIQVLLTVQSHTSTTVARKRKMLTD
jgi:hypothetical protein